VVWSVSNYLIDIPLIIAFAVAALFDFIRVGMISTISANDWTNPPRAYFNGQQGATVAEAKQGQQRMYGNFYLRSLLDGQFPLRWLSWTLAGSALLWGVLTLVPISDVFLLVTLIILFYAILAAGWMEEWMNVASFKTISVLNPIEVKGGQPMVRRLSTNWMPFITGVFINAWLWVVVFIYLGYSDNFNPSAYLWYRLAAVIITGIFFLFIMPLVMLIWLIKSPSVYREWSVKLYTVMDSESDEKMTIADYYASVKDNDKSFFALPSDMRKDIMYYAIYSNFTKNVVYEMTMGILGTVCLHTVIWIIFGGMLSY